jgi:hypothetical protein
MIEARQLTKRHGRRGSQLHRPPRYQVGALLDANVVHTGRSAGTCASWRPPQGSVAVASRGSSTSSAGAKKQRSAR